jgi:hypothetical protein
MPKKPKYNFVKALKTAVFNFAFKPRLFGVFLAWAAILIAFSSYGIKLPGVAVFLGAVILDLYLLAMVITDYNISKALELFRTRLWFYIILNLAILFFFIPAIVSIVYIYIRIPAILLNILLYVIAIIGVYAVFIRLYIIAPLIALRNKNVKLFEALYDAWRVSKKHSKLLVIATTVAAIFLAITTVLPTLLPKNIYTVSASILISSITLPIAKLMLADIGIKLLKKELA